MSESIKALRVLRDAAQAMHSNAATKTDNRITAAVVSDLANDAIAAIESAEQAQHPVATYADLALALQQIVARTLDSIRRGQTMHVDFDCHNIAQTALRGYGDPPAEQPCAMCVASNCVCHCKLPCSKHSAKADEQPKPCGARDPFGPFGERCVLPVGHDGDHSEQNEAEQPKPCACGGGAGTSGWSHSIHGCHHLPKPPADQAQHPAPTDVPPMPEALAPQIEDGHAMMRPHHNGLWCRLSEVRALHAACVRLAERCERAVNEASNAQQERDEARRELEAERARADKAEAEQAALKGQEPVAWMWVEDGIMHESSRTNFTTNRAFVPSNGKPLYAVPVASIPLEQHEAAIDALCEIHDYAHENSFGPEVNDALWEVRNMAGRALLAPQGVK